MRPAPVNPFCMPRLLRRACCAVPVAPRPLRRAPVVARVRPIYGRTESVTLLQGIFELANALIGLMIWAIILAAVFSMLSSFGVLDTRNRLVWTIGDFLFRVTDPLLRPVRNALPSFGSIDLSPLVVLLLLQYVARPLLSTLYTGIAYGHWSLI